MKNYTNWKSDFYVRHVARQATTMEQRDMFTRPLKLSKKAKAKLKKNMK